MAICASFVALIAPKICNKLTKQDVEDYVKNKSSNTTVQNNINKNVLFNNFKDFITKK